MNTTEWIEQFTGKAATDGAPKGDDPELETQRLENEAAIKRALLADAYKRVLPLKAEFQKAMSTEVNVRDKFFKERLLDVEGTQMDEAEYEEIDFSSIKLSPAVQAIVDRGSNTIAMQGERLAKATIDRPGKPGDILFEPIEIEDGYWFPLTRERILPETFTGALYSKTQRMINETNDFYKNATAEKREKGELTPKANRIRDLVQSGAELATVGADLTAAFGAGTENAKLAVDILNVMVAVAEGGVEAYDKIKAKEYADGAKSVLGTMKILTSAILKGAKVDPGVIKVVEKGFLAGGAAITAGKHFARGADGAADGTNVLAGVLGSVFEIAASRVENPQTAKALKIVAVSAPMTMRAAATSGKLIQSLSNKDVAGAVDCLGSFATNALSGVQGLRAITETEGQSKEKTEKTEKQLKEEQDRIQALIELGTEGVKLTAVVALAAKRGQYQKAFDELVTRVGSSLTKALTSAGLPEDQAKKIGIIYNSAASGVTALECMMAEEPDVPGALNALGSGIGLAFDAAAPGSAAMKKAGAGLQEGFKGLADAAAVTTLYKTGQYDEAMELFLKSVKTRLGATLRIAGVGGGGGSDEEGDTSGEGDQPAGKLQEALQQLGLSVSEAKDLIASKVDDALEAEVQRQARAEADEEAQAILEEANADVSEAEQFGRDAADIEKLIAKIQRDKMIMQIALQVMQGGTAFLASFIPALGAASAAIKMMASMVAAAQRAEQLAYWVNSHSDFTAAQSALSSSAQNFVTNQAQQFTHHSIQAAFAAAELIGNVLETVGAATWGAGEAAGMGLKVAAKAGAKIEQILYKHAKIEQMEYGWKITQRALKNPTNRKLGLRARALNPTLAKYSIAWGAVKLKDPLARNALRACDLTEAVLENENANVDKVVEYLEAFYDEDDKMYREVEADGPWVPTDITLTLRFWSRVKTLAVKEVKLANPDTSALDGKLAQLKTDIAKLDKSGLADRVLLLQDIDRTLGAWVPDIKNEKGLSAMKGVIKVLRKQAMAGVNAAKAREEQLAGDQERLIEQERKVREKALAERKFVVDELKRVIANANSLDDSTDQLDMFDAEDEAETLLKDVAGLEALKDDPEVVKLSKELKAALDNVQRLITMAELAAV